MATKAILIFVLLAAALVGCSNATLAVEATPIPSNTPTLEFNLPTSAPEVTPSAGQSPTNAPDSFQPPSTQQIVLDRAFEIISILKNKEMSKLAQFVHPQLGLQFSPYATVKDTDQVFAADKVARLMDDPTMYLWGNYDGTGEPINLTFTDYYSKFIYDEDFANAPQLALNHRLSTGNSIDNTFEYYQSSMYVEFYFPGFEPQYEGMDWRSLRLVFMQQSDDWFLVGIIHDQWTT